jgi:superfamily I DNA/RNA helicase
MIDLQLASKSGSLEYPARVVETYGIESIRDRPRVTVGTIHSVKGAEASKIYLLPDISRASMEQWINGDSDSIRRTFYVGMTRAKNDLVLCGASTKWAVPWMI